MKEKVSGTINTPRSSFPLHDSLKTCANWMRQHIYIILFGVVLVVAAFIRLWAASLSTGPDVAQFWAFAKVFQTHGLDFYRYADGQGDIFPMQGWGFVYPPVWLLILRVALFFAPSSSATAVMVDPGWRLAMKIPIIAADLAIGLLLYWAVPGSKRRKLLFASLWLLHPTAWFESGVFGQFDAVAAAFLLACVIFLIKGKDRLAFLFAGLAVMTKQHTLIAIGMMIIVCTRYMNMRRLLTNCAIFAGVIALFSLPFLLTGNVLSYARSLFLPASAPGYQWPLCFSFSGSGALLTYLHDVFGWDTTDLISFMIPVMIIALSITAMLCYWRRITPLQGALAGFLVFISFSYQVNYQYLVVYIPLAILLASRTQYKIEKIFTLVLAILPAVWVWLANMPWWFHNFQPFYLWVNPILAHMGLLDRYLPDWVYVAFAVGLMCLSLAYVVSGFSKWQQPQVE